MSLSIAGHAAGATAGPALVVDVSAGSNACTADATGARTCDVAVGAAPGLTSFDIRSFDAPAGAGSQLAHALVALPATTAPVVAITVVLDGDAATVALALAGAPFTQGVAGSQTLAVTAADADGNVITGPGLYDVPVVLAASDGAIALTPTTVTGPGQTVTVAYDGAPGSTSFVTAAVVGSPSGGTVLRVVGPQTPSSTPSPFPTGVPVAPTPTPGVSAIIVVH